MPAQVGFLFTASAKRPSREEMDKVDRARRRRISAVREIGRGAGPQEQANAALDLLTLLATAQRHGLSPRRVELLRERVKYQPALAPEAVQRLA
jgi:hypothetical protein